MNFKSIFQKIAYALSALVILVGVYATFIGKKNVEEPAEQAAVAPINKCTDKNKATVAFREGCGPSTALGFSAHWQVREQWCKCVEEKFDIREFLDKDCSQPNAGNLMRVWNSDQVKVACGTPAEPI